MHRKIIKIMGKVKSLLQLWFFFFFLTDKNSKTISLNFVESLCCDNELILLEKGISLRLTIIMDKFSN